MNYSSKLHKLPSLFVFTDRPLSFADVQDIDIAGIDYPPSRNTASVILFPLPLYLCCLRVGVYALQSVTFAPLWYCKFPFANQQVSLVKRSINRCIVLSGTVVSDQVRPVTIFRSVPVCISSQPCTNPASVCCFKYVNRCTVLNLSSSIFDLPYYDPELIYTVNYLSIRIFCNAQ